MMKKASRLLTGYFLGSQQYTATSGEMFTRAMSFWHLQNKNGWMAWQATTKFCFTEHLISAGKIINFRQLCLNLLNAVSTLKKKCIFQKRIF